jgi:hypothetical protein
VVVQLADDEAAVVASTQATGLVDSGVIPH